MVLPQVLLLAAFSYRAVRAVLMGLLLATAPTTRAIFIFNRCNPVIPSIFQTTTSFLQPDLCLHKTRSRPAFAPPPNFGRPLCDLYIVNNFFYYFYFFNSIRPPLFSQTSFFFTVSLPSKFPSTLTTKFKFRNLIQSTTTIVVRIAVITKI